jgi:capsular exopolysaccharide synthesis family protein
MSEERADPTLADYVDVLRRNLRLIVVVALALPVLAFLWSAQQSARYRASAEVMLNTQNLASAVTGISTGYVDPTRFGETQAKLARIPAVVQSALRRAKVRDMTTADLVANSSVAPRNDADFLTFTVESGRSEEATRLATAYARAFTAYKLNSDTRTLALARAELESRLEDLRERGSENGAVVSDLQKKIQDLRTLELLQAPATVVAAAADAVKVAPTPVRNAVLALLVGLILGVAVALLRNTLDRTIRTEDEIERALALPLLARIPTDRRARAKEQLAMLEERSNYSAEAFRILRTNLELANIDLQARVLLVSSATSGEGKSTTAANLAIAIGRAGRSVALVDLDLRRPTLATYFGFGGRPGVTDVLQGRLNVASALAPVRLPTPDPSMSRRSQMAGRISVLTAGTPPASNPGELISSERLAPMLDELREQFDVVLVDTPALLEVGDAMRLMSEVDGVVVVVRMGTVDTRGLKELARNLETVPTPKLGFVVTDVEPRQTYGVRSDGYATDGRRDEPARPKAGRSVTNDAPARAPSAERPPGERRWAPGVTGDR